MDRKQDHQDTAAIEALFDGARRSAPIPRADFLERLEADMERLVPKVADVAPAAPSSAGFLERFRGVFAASGLTGAAALGVWIGFVMPDTLDALATGFDTTEVSGIGAFLPHADLAALEE